MMICMCLFTPQVKGDLLEPEVILAVADCTPKVILQDFIQLFIEIQINISLLCEP